MTTTWANCPQGFMWPNMMGLKQSNGYYTFTASAPVLESLDFNEHFAVTCGHLEQTGLTNFWPWNDVEIDLCEGANCST